ncbi:uncharacterized protein LOC132273126 [Cornus florida]|uniref:uncharacterized protein LOC132273126 n=1 Tax=Cornus florida TaxID=4283 RepID=UPI0028984534|nr:uncharacterized protein LOC132273126 [Cornus florida]
MKFFKSHSSSDLAAFFAAFYPRDLDVLRMRLRLPNDIQVKASDSSFGRRKNPPPATNAARATSSPASASSSATISDTIPSVVAIDLVVSTPAPNPSTSPQITTTPAAAEGVRDKERGKRPHPDGGVNLEEEYLTRRTRVSGPSALLHRPVKAPAPSGPVAAAASASASASASAPTPVLPPWAP